MVYHIFRDTDSFDLHPFGQVAHSHQRGERRPGGGCSPHFGCPDKSYSCVMGNYVNQGVMGWNGM
jgi:hypothetical protein